MKHIRYIEQLDPLSIICEPELKFGNDAYGLKDDALKLLLDYQWSQGIFVAPQYIKVDQVVWSKGFKIDKR